MSFVFAADLHLSQTTWAKHPTLSGDAEAALIQIVDYCVEHRLPLILGGDVLEKQRPEPGVIQYMLFQLDRMQDSNLPVYYVQGQHDMDRHTPWLSCHEWTIHVHEQTFEIGGLKLYGLDWLPASQIKEALAEIPEGTHVLVGHQVWEDWFALGAECCFGDIHHVTNLLSGDLHQHDIKAANNAQGGSMMAFSPGATHMRKTDEPRSHFFFKLSEVAGSLAADAILLQSRPVLEYTAKTDTALTGILQGLGASIDGAKHDAKTYNLHPAICMPMVLIKFDQNIPEAFMRIENALIAHPAHLFAMAYDESVAEIVVDVTNPEQFVSWQSSLNQLEPDEQVRADVLALVASPEPEAVLDGIRGRFCEENNATG